LQSTALNFVGCPQVKAVSWYILQLVIDCKGVVFGNPGIGVGITRDNVLSWQNFACEVKFNSFATLLTCLNGKA
jgi:hypothetical protein